MRELSDSDLRLTAEGDVLDILSQHGGEVLVAGPATYQLTQELTDLLLAYRKREKP